MSRTIGQVAELAGVSTSTVSRALAGKPGVSDSKRREICRIAESLGFVPNVYARTLRTGRPSGMVLVMRAQGTEVVTMRNYALMARGKAALGSVRVVVLNENESLSETVRDSVATGCRALVISNVRASIDPEVLALVRERGTAVATVDGGSDGVDSVQIDRSVGTYQAARMLLLSGRRHVCCYSSCKLDHPDPRMEGVLRAYDSMDRPRSEIVTVKFRAGYEGGRETVRELLRTRAVDAVFAYNDAAATGTLRGLAEQGVKVPDEVAVVGFDNLPFTASLPVSLTTVAQPVEEAADAAIELVLSRLEDFGAEPRTVVYPTRLIVRESAPICDHALREQVFAAP